jgi:hypothetical protein
MKRRSEEEQRVARLHFDSERLIVGDHDLLLTAVTVGPDDGGTIVGPIRRERPHHVDEIFHARAVHRPHLLIPVWGLRQAARQDLDRLGQVQLDNVAMRLEDDFSGAENGVVQHECRHPLAPAEKSVEALGVSAVERADRSRRHLENRREIARKGINQLPTHRLSHDAISAIEQRRGDAPSAIISFVISAADRAGSVHAAALSGMSASARVWER